MVKYVNSEKMVDGILSSLTPDELLGLLRSKYGVAMPKEKYGVENSVGSEEILRLMERINPKSTRDFFPGGAVIGSDVKKLKVVNSNLGQNGGDAYLGYTAMKMENYLTSLKLGDDTQTQLLRSNTAGDEFLTIINSQSFSKHDLKDIVNDLSQLKLNKEEFEQLLESKLDRDQFLDIIKREKYSPTYSENKIGPILRAVGCEYGNNETPTVFNARDLVDRAIGSVKIIETLNIRIDPKTEVVNMALNYDKIIYDSRIVLPDFLDEKIIR